MHACMNVPLMKKTPYRLFNKRNTRTSETTPCVSICVWDCITGSYYRIILQNIMELYYGITFMKRIPGMPGTSPEPPGIPGVPWACPWNPGDVPWPPRGRP